MTKCPACGAEVAKTAAACPSCGRSLEDATASLPVVEAPLSAQSASPRAEAGPTLVVVRGPEVGERFALDRPSLSIGRAPDCDVFLNDVTVSRRHARMLKSEAGVTIIDDDSLNGTYVNDTCVSTAVLHDGDHVRIGRFQMVFFSGEGS